MVPKLSETSTDLSLRGRRDAFHVPGVLVTSINIVYPGNKVYFIDTDCTKVRLSISGDPVHAIVSPFLSKMVSPGDLFWVCPVQEIVGNLTHSFEITPNDRPQPLPVDEEVDDDTCKGCYD